MKPSITALYHRGRYLRTYASPDDESPEGGAERHERERYAVAALAFCIRHDPSYRLHFFSRILSLPYDSLEPEIVLENGDIDLIAIFESPRGKHVVAVEAKLGAGLSRHQNPSEKEFWIKGQPNGYGATIAELYPDANQVDFIVLGHPEEIKPRSPSKTTKPQWSFRQIGWGDLDLPTDQLPTSLTQDFFDLLANFHVPAFAMKLTEKLRVCDSLRDAVLAQLVLRHVGQSFGLAEKLIRPHTDIVDDKSWFLGVNIAQRETGGDRLGNIIHLTRLVQPERRPKQPLGWFGYEGDGAKTALSIYLYCGSQAVAQMVQKKIPETLQAKIHSDWGIFITKSDSDNRPDREWFTSAFKALGLKEAR